MYPRLLEHPVLLYLPKKIEQKFSVFIYKLHSNERTTLVPKFQLSLYAITHTYLKITITNVYKRQ